MSSARGANKAQGVGRMLAGGSRNRKRHERAREIKNLERQVTERLELLARFRARLSPAEDPS